MDGLLNPTRWPPHNGHLNLFSVRLIRLQSEHLKIIVMVSPFHLTRPDIRRAQG
jgi:nicotinic acid mononucleotide adenylyltransferase